MEKNLTDVLNEIKNTSSTKDKVRILRENDSKLLRDLLVYTYSPDILFGITSSQIGVIQSGIGTEYPFGLYSRVVEASGRNEKIGIIHTTLTGKTKDIVNYFLRSIDKDLGIGISVKLINKAFPNLIKDFRLMLAHKQSKEDFLSYFKDTEWCFVNIKIDGIRCVCEIVNKDDIRFYSRDGKRLQDFLVENIKKDIQRQFAIDTEVGGILIDGEIYSTNFQDLMTVVNRKEITSQSLLIRNSCKFAVFDVIVDNMILEDRVKLLHGFVKQSTFISLVKYVKVKTDYSLLRRLADLKISQGQEGIMVKHPKSLYEYKRSKYWQKFKGCNDVDLEIIDIQEGEKGTKYEGQLGALILRLENGNTVNCGTGFSDQERIDLWKIKEELKGKIAEIKFMEMTKDGSLRHPVFVRLRPDKEK